MAVKLIYLIDNYAEYSCNSLVVNAQSVSIGVNGSILAFSAHLCFTAFVLWPNFYQNYSYNQFVHFLKSVLGLTFSYLQGFEL